MCKYSNASSKMKTLKVNFKMKRRLTPVKEETPKTLSFNSDSFIYLSVIATAIFSYYNSLNGDFVHDDIPAIVTNKDVIGTNSLRHLFLDDFWGTPMADVNSHKSYRPLTTLSFRLNHAISGLKPWWWHASNVILHAACCALVARACFTVARLQRPFAALAALLFAVHPVHTEAVAGVVGRADILACIFFLSSLLVYHRSENNSKKYVWLSVILGALSMLAKETGVTILFINLAFDYYRSWPLVRRSFCSFKIERKSTGLSIRTIKIFVSLAFLLCLRLALLQGSLPSFSTQDNPAAFHPSFFVRLMTFCYLAAFNWWLLLCPWSLSHDWQMGSIPLVISGWDPRNLLTCAAFGALFLLCYRCFNDFEIQRHVPMVLGVSLLVIPFIPASNLFVTVGFVIAERVLYIPSVGSVILTAYGVQLMWYSRPSTKLFLIIGLLILAISGIAKTHRRNSDWKDRATLLRVDLAGLPQNAKLHYNFGNYLRESEQPDGAIRHYKEALRLWPSYASAHNNLGTLVSGIENAEQHFLKAIYYNKYHVNAHYNLGKLYKKSNRNIEAINMFEKCISLQHSFVQAYVELLSLKGDRDKTAILEKLFQLEPENWENYFVYGYILKSRGDMKRAEVYYLKATKLAFLEQSTDKTTRADLLTVRAMALIYRSLGQKSRILQLLTRWHTWKRGWTDAATTHMYLRDWHLKQELNHKAQLYTKASVEIKSTTCFDHTQLSTPPSPKTTTSTPTLNSQEANSVTENKKTSEKTKTNCCKTCNCKKRPEALQSQVTHNKSEIEMKNKCRLHRKDNPSNNVKTSDVITNIGAPMVEHVLLKKF